MSTYTVRQFGDIIGVSVKTLQRWDRGGRLKPKRTPSNRRMYTDQDLVFLRGQSQHSERITIVYSRVSSQAQKPDLENQVKVLEQFCAGAGIPVDEWVKEIGGGLNFQRKKFTHIIDQIVTGQASKFVIAHKDRLSRFGFELIEHLCSVNGCELIVMNNESLSPEQEMVQDMLSIVHGFSVRLYGLRNYTKSLQQALSDDSRA